MIGAFLTVRDAAKKIGMSERTFKNKVLPTLPFYRVSERKILIETGELDGWLSKRREVAMSDPVVAEIVAEMSR